MGIMIPGATAGLSVGTVVVQERSGISRIAGEILGVGRGQPTLQKSGGEIQCPGNAPKGFSTG